MGCTLTRVRSENSRPTTLATLSSSSWEGVTRRAASPEMVASMLWLMPMLARR